MRFVYAHFPINVVLNADGTVVEVRNFLGEKINRTVVLPVGVKAVRSEKVKDESKRDEAAKFIVDVLDPIVTREEDGTKYLGYCRLRAVGRKK